MSDLTNKIIELIKQNKTVNEISNETNLSNKQLYNIISIIGNSGYVFDRKYYYDGNIIYNQRYKILDSNNDGVKGIITNRDLENISFILISDLHFGSLFERVDLMNIVYDYATKNGINLIIVAGDLIDGSYGSAKLYNDTSKQIEHLLRDYPFDKNILSFAVLGDHDYSSLKDNGQDISKILNSYRHDIIPIGYQQGKIRIKKDDFSIRHKFAFKQNDTGVKNIDVLNEGILIKGHTHEKLTASRYGKLFIITLPPFCDLKNDILPSFSVMTLHFNNMDKINKVILKHNIVLGGKIQNISEIASEIIPDTVYYDDSLIENNKSKYKTINFTRKINDLNDLY